MNCNTWEVTFLKESIKFCGSEGALHKYDDLIVIQDIKHLVKLPVLFCFAKLNVVLSEAVQGKLRFVIYIDLERILHELFAHGTDFLG